MIIETTILKMGADGDGIFEFDGKTYYVPYTLPDEKVKVEIEDDKATLIELLSASSHRVEAPCPHYTKCGGCKLQHVSQEYYKQFKLSLQEGADDIILLPNTKRRRATFTGDGNKIGFNAERTNKVVEIDNCMLLNDTLNACLKQLQDIAPNIGRASILATETNNGVDLDIITNNKNPAPEMIQQLSTFARNNGIARITINKEPLVTLVKPMITLSGKEVDFVAGGFLQPTIESEKVLTELVCGAFKRKAKIADLFCGCGTFAYALWEKGHKVTGFDINTTHPFTKRDLEQNPVTWKEMNDYKAIVFDPPRAGSDRIAGNIAKSKVPLVVAVSCNPKTFRRDKKTMEACGYKMQNITLVDQFLYSAHIELVATFTK